MYRPNWINIYEEKFYKNDFLLVDFQEDDLPMFGKVSDLVVAARNIPIAVIDLYRTEGINGHIAAYLIERTNEKTFTLLSSLRYKHSLYAHSYNRKLYIALKTHVHR